MMYDRKEIENLPEVFNLERLRCAIHVSKKSCAYFLNSGLIPCYHNGKRTHSYFIKKSDLIAAIDRYEQNPALFFRPGKGAPKRRRLKNVYNYLPKADVGSPIAAAYYREKYEEISDLVDVETVAEMTGYRPLTVNKWCNDGKLRYVSHYPKRWIAKRILIEFLISDTYNSIGNKSEVHKLDLTHIFRRIHNLPDLKEAEEDAQQSPAVTGPQAAKEEAVVQVDEAAAALATAEAVNTPPVQESPVPAVKVRQAVTQTHSEPAAGHTIAAVPVKKALAPGSSHNAVRVSRSGDGKHEFKPEPQAIKTSTGFSDRQTGMKTTPENGFKPAENARPVVVIKRKTRRN